MPNYKEITIEGTKYQRACRITIENPLGEIPKVVFVEEEITILPEQSKSHRLVGSLQIDFDPNEMIPMIDPETNLPTETIYPAALAQWIIYSLYFKRVGERDNPPV